MSAAGFLFIVFGLAFAITGVKGLRAGYAFQTALIRCGDIPPDRNPLDPQTAFRDLKRMAMIFRPHANPEAECARLRIIRAYRIWLLLMFLWMVSFFVLLVIQGPS